MDVMKNYFLALLVLVSTIDIAAQSRRTISVRAGEDLGEA